MRPITPDPATFDVAGGVDTHSDSHTAAVIDQIGRVLGTQQFPTTPAGYTALLAWMRGFGRLGPVGVEGTGAYGAGLARQLRDEQVQVIEVGPLVGTGWSFVVMMQLPRVDGPRCVRRLRCNQPTPFPPLVRRAVLDNELFQRAQ